VWSILNQHADSAGIGLQAGCLNCFILLEQITKSVRLLLAIPADLEGKADEVVRLELVQR
jgi:hypothetical protein